MLRKLLIYLLIVLGLGILYISTSKKWMERVSSIRNESNGWWGVHESSDKGDLLNMAYLDLITKFHSKRDYSFHKPQQPGPSNINLYMQGDSYTFKIPDSAFYGVNRYEYVWVGTKSIAYNMDTTKKNILIIERAERYVRIHYSGLDLLQEVYDSAKGPEYEKLAGGTGVQPQVTSAEAMTDIIPPKVDTFISKFFNENINQNIEYNLFNYNILNAPRLIKAWLNYHVFKRASGNVSVSADGNRLFIAETLNPGRPESSYSLISSEEYNNIVRNLNILYDYYRNEGFDEMYLAIIPNPVTIHEPKGYNNLIPRLQSDTALRMKFIDIYQTYKSSDTVIYRPGDTHWYNSGMQMWINTVNDTLRKWNKMP